MGKTTLLTDARSGCEAARRSSLIDGGDVTGTPNLRTAVRHRLCAGKARILAAELSSENLDQSPNGLTLAAPRHDAKSGGSTFSRDEGRGKRITNGGGGDKLSGGEQQMLANRRGARNPACDH